LVFVGFPLRLDTQSESTRQTCTSAAVHGECQRPNESRNRSLVAVRHEYLKYATHSEVLEIAGKKETT